MDTPDYYWSVERDASSYLYICTVYSFTEHIWVWNSKSSTCSFHRLHHCTTPMVSHTECSFFIHSKRKLRLPLLSCTLHVCSTVLHCCYRPAYVELDVWSVSLGRQQPYLPKTSPYYPRYPADQVTWLVTGAQNPSLCPLLGQILNPSAS